MKHVTLANQILTCIQRYKAIHFQIHLMPIAVYVTIAGTIYCVIPALAL